MPVPPYEPKPDLTTQRVPGGRRAAFVVVVVAVLVVGTLVWKPWESGVSGATPAPTSRPAVADTTPSPGPSLEATPSPLATFPVDGLGSVELRTDTGPQVVCTYKTIGRGRKAKQVISEMTAPSPVVTLGSAALDVGLKQIDLYLNLESNSLATIFNAEWQPLQGFDGPSQSVQIYRSTPVFEPITIRFAFTPDRDDEVYRMSLRFDWLNANGDKLDTQYFTLNSYGPEDTTEGSVVSEGCPATAALAR
jgi:hypothetical protein